MPKPTHHPDTAHFVALIVAEVQALQPRLVVICRDRSDLNQIRNLVNAMLEQLNLRPRLMSLNLIGWRNTRILFRLPEAVQPYDLEVASVFVSPELADQGLPEETERALAGFPEAPRLNGEPVIAESHPA